MLVLIDDLFGIGLKNVPYQFQNDSFLILIGFVFFVSGVFRNYR